MKNPFRKKKEGEQTFHVVFAANFSDDWEWKIRTYHGREYKEIIYDVLKDGQSKSILYDIKDRGYLILDEEFNIVHEGRIK